MKETYEIPTSNLVVLEDKISKFNKRAIKIKDASPIWMEVGEKYLKEFEEYVNPVTTRKYKIEMVSVVINGEAPKYNGWMFKGCIEHVEDENLLRLVPGVTIPKQYRNASPEDCDHCKMRRNRKKSFILKHESGKYRQVGSTCVKDFLGGNDPHSAAMYAERFFSFFGSEIEDMEEFDPSIGRGATCFDLDEIFTVAAMMIRKFGWLSKSKALDDEVSTSDQVLDYLGDSNYWGALIPTADDKEKAQLTIEHLEELSQKDVPSDYEFNCLVLYRLGYARFKDIGIATSIVAVAKMTRERKEQAKIDFGKSDHVGEIKERLRDVHIRVVGKFQKDGFYGLTSILTMLDDDGNVLKWFGNSARAHAAEKNDKYYLTGTVKKHGEYKGIKETMLNRCILNEV